MKVVFSTYSRIGLNIGGLQNQISLTRAELIKKGIEVTLHDQWKDLDCDCDILHLFATDSSNNYLAKKAKDRGIKVVISPVLNAFSQSKYLYKMKTYLSKLPGVYSDIKRTKEVFFISDKIIALNLQEKELISFVFNVPRSKIEVVPNGTEARFFQSKGKRKNNVINLLQVGTVEKRKNQLSVVKAINSISSGETRFNYTIVGPIKDIKYHRDLLVHAKDNVVLKGPIPYSSKELLNEYKKADAFILPSFSEVMPLVLYEAAASNCKLIVSKSFPIQSEIKSNSFLINPNNEKSITNALLKLEKGEEKKDFDTSFILTWEAVSDRIASIYDEVK